MQSISCAHRYRDDRRQLFRVPEVASRVGRGRRRARCRLGLDRGHRAFETLPHWGHIEVLGVEVSQPMRHSGPDSCGQTRRNFVCAISQRHPHRETLGEILSGGIVFGVGGNEIHIVLLRLDPARRGSMTGIKRGVRAFVNEGFFKYAFGLIQIRLTCMNEISSYGLGYSPL